MSEAAAFFSQAEVISVLGTLTATGPRNGWRRNERNIRRITMAINECCNIGVVCCEAGTSISDVAALMRKHHVGDVIVVEDMEENRIPTGIVTDRDIVIETMALHVDADAFTAGELMSAPLVTVREDEGFVETLQLMRKHKVRRMPVVTAAGTLFGIVTADDIVNLLARELTMMTEAIVEQPLREGRLRK
jgi:CBS domain-containing protein